MTHLRYSILDIELFKLNGAHDCVDLQRCTGPISKLPVQLSLYTGTWENRVLVVKILKLSFNVEPWERHIFKDRSLDVLIDIGSLKLEQP